MGEETGAKLRRRVESLFYEVQAKPPDQREKYLAEACQDDEEVYREVKSLLFHFEQSSPLDQSPLEPPFQPAFAQGEKLGPYEIIRQLGKGGMGEVYLARDSRLGRKVALKILPEILAGNPELIERLRREAQTASALNHPNILTIYEFGQQGHIQYIASEFVEGTELRDLIGRLSTAEIVDYARQIGQAIAAAHSVGIVHRDIKPENIMVRSDGIIKVLDFGLAKLMPQLVDAGRLYERISSVRSEPGLLVGTINYMSPEQVRGQAVDHRTDIWSWGVVLYEMLAGKRPFDAVTPSDVLANIITREPVPPCKDGEINRAVANALKKRPEDRYQSMGEALRNLPAGRRRGFQPGRLVAVVIIACALLVGGFLLYRNRLPQPFRIESMVHLTTSGNVQEGAISPDGNFAAYATQERHGETLKITEVGTGVEQEKIAPSSGEYRGITFSRDGRFIYYVFLQNELGKLYRVPMVGGDSRMLVNDVDSPISFSPDGSQFVFVRNNPVRREVSLIVRSLDASAERILVTLKAPRNFWHYPLWSVDGSFVVCGSYSESPVGRSSIKIMGVRLSDGNLIEIGPEPWYWMGKPVWIKNGKSLAVPATNVNSNHPQLMEVSWPEGEVSGITHDTGDYRNLDASADSRKLVTVAVQRDSHIWTVSLADRGRTSLVAKGKYFGVAWTPAGGLISQTDTGGHPELWYLEPGSGASHPLTDDGFVKQDAVPTPDGKFVVYSSLRDGGFHLWRSNSDGSNSVRLTSSQWRETQAAVTPDSQWLIYTSNESGFDALWKVPISGGKPERITDRTSREPSISPDGRWIACKYAENPSGPLVTVILQADTGEFVRSFPAIPEGSRVRWSTDGKQLFFIETDGATSNIWGQPVDGGKPKQLTQFTEGLIFSFAPSPDGKSLACVRGSRTSNLVLMQSAK